MLSILLKNPTTISWSSSWKKSLILRLLTNKGSPRSPSTTRASRTLASSKRRLRWRWNWWRSSHPWRRRRLMKYWRVHPRKLSLNSWQALLASHLCQGWWTLDLNIWSRWVPRVRPGTYLTRLKDRSKNKHRINNNKKARTINQDPSPKST